MRAALISINICAKSSLTNQLTTIFSKPHCPVIALNRLTAICHERNGSTLATAPATPLDQPAMPMTIDLTIYFDFDSALLLPKSKTQLTALCAAIKADTGEGTYQIIGHTDAKGKASYNQRLSQARADEVVRYMTTSCDIDSARLKAVGAGEGHLKLPGEPRSPENRRVEVQVLS